MLLNRRLFQGATAVACALAASAAVAGERPTTTDAPAEKPAMRVFIDPVTGEFREPTAAELDAMKSEAKSARKPAAHPDFAGSPATVEEAAKTVQHHADGSVSALVPDELASNLVSHVGPGGRLAIHHSGPAAQKRPATLRNASTPAVEVADE